MGGDTRGSVKRVITDTVDKLQKASACTNDVGDRYSRLIRLLWRKPPARDNIPQQSIADAPCSNASQLHATTSRENPSNLQPMDQTNMYDPLNQPPSINTFSWLDLPAVGDFATLNNGLTRSMDGFDRYDDSSTDGLSNFDPSMMMPQHIAWNNMSPSGIIF